MVRLVRIKIAGLAPEGRRSRPAELVSLKQSMVPLHCDRDMTEFEMTIVDSKTALAYSWRPPLNDVHIL